MAYTRIDFTNPEGELVAYGCKSPSEQNHVCNARHFLVHTKYVGRSSDHAVSTGPDVTAGMTETWVVQNNVELSEDGERLIGGVIID